MNLAEIRRLVIIAMFSDDLLMSRLVLKGGTALDLVYKITNRSSIDVDFSLEGDFPDPAEIEARIFRALRDRFDSKGYIVFDESFGPRPSVVREGRSKWGGYRAEFKIIEKSKAKAFLGSLDQLRRNASVLGETQKRTFSIDISKYEFCSNKEVRELDYYTIYVYSPEMLAIEKLRALSQQLPGYSLQTTPRARAQDFYDIHAIVTRCELNLESPENLALLRNIFDAKDVQLSSLARLGDQKDLHEPDWPSILSTTLEPPQHFDFYFDYVVNLAKKLEAAVRVK